MLLGTGEITKGPHDASMHFVDLGRAINPLEQSLVRVALQNWRQLLLEYFQPALARVGAIVYPSADLASLDKTLDEHRVRNREEQRGPDLGTVFLQPSIERLDLGERPRETVKHGASEGIRPLEPAKDHFRDSVIRQQLTSAHDVLARLRLVLPEQLAARDVGDAKYLA